MKKNYLNTYKYIMDLKKNILIINQQTINKFKQLGWNLNIKYSNSDNIDFRTIYQKIADDRAITGAHTNVNKLTKKTIIYNLL
jgi:hypothetical protein